VPIWPKPGLTPEWLKLCLRRPCFLQYADAKSYGTKMPRLGTKDAKASRHPVPPKAEQGRIIQ
jgi:type I restriction enzyme S subunit